MLELFIYYRVAAAEAPQALATVQGWQAALRLRHPGLQARLLKKHPAGEAGVETWMEIYAARHDGPDLVAELQAELVEGPPLYAAGTERHVEAFVPCAW